MTDKKEDGNIREDVSENIIQTLNDEKNRELLHGVLKPVVDSLITSKFSDIEKNIKKDILREVGDTVKSIIETNLNDVGIPLNKKRDLESDEDEEHRHKKRAKLFEGNVQDDCGRKYSSADEAIAHWRKMANKEWESARRTDLTELNGVITVLCLDTSASMRENKALEHAIQFCKNYLDMVADIHSELVALVVFGKETKVQRRFTKDYTVLKSEIDQLKPEGPSPMFGGLVLSKAVAKTFDCSTIIDETDGMRLLPKIILITDGKPTDIIVVDGPERTDSADVRQTLKIIEDETKTFKDKNVELHIIYVGKPDYDFLHSLRECTGGMMMPYSDAEKLAVNTFTDVFIRRIQLSREKTKSGEKGQSDTAEASESLRKLQMLKEDMKLKIEALHKLPAFSILPGFAEILEKKRIRTKDKYLVADDKTKKYPRIGSRVRRAKDWQWGNQDGNGPGTIIGHFLKENSGKDRQIMVWVEWDVDERQNVYRFKTTRSTKADIKIVGEERVPPDDEILAVGMKVSLGPDYVGEQKPRQGVVLRIIDEEEDDEEEEDVDAKDKKASNTGEGPSRDENGLFCKNNEPADISKAEVLWENDERGLYFFGEKGSKVEIQPRLQLSKPDKPRNITVSDFTDREVSLKWNRPASCGGCNIKKYIVLKKSDKLGDEWQSVLEVENNETKATITNLEQNESYKFAVLAENKVGPGDMLETNDFIKLGVSFYKPEPPVGPLNIRDVTKSSCTVCWKKSPIRENKPVKNYIVEFRETGKSSWEKVIVENATEYRLTQLRKSTTYELQVKSVNDTGVSDPLGAESFVTRTFLDSDIPHVTLQDKHLAQLATSLGGDWQLLGHYFGLTNVEVGHISMQNKSAGVAMLIFNMLSVWRQRNPGTATFYKLIEGIEAVSAVTVDWDKIADVARKIKEAD